MGQQPTRRNVIKQLVIGGSAAVASPLVSLACNTTPEVMGTKKGNVNHSVCRWTYGHLPLDKLCIAVKKLGFAAIDLVGPKESNVLKTHGIFSSMCNG
ncbi:MAG: hydroxypyruvate isomerase, partial [Chitinophagaceae bacterium]